MALKQHPEMDRMLQVAADRGARDIFLLPDEPLSLRINEEIERTDSPVLSGEVIEQIATAAIGAEKVAKIPMMGHASTNCGLPGVMAGQMTVTSAGGKLAMTIRVIPSKIPSIKDISLPASVLEAAAKKSGVILFSGHVGSGKTTTAYSIISHLNTTQAKLICTIEEPIAYALTAHRPLILQREVGTDVPDFHTGIAASVRQDADVIFVGELRSADDAFACLTAAGLSRLVMTQTHARTALRALHRLIEIQPPERRETFRRHLADTLLASVAQTLLPKADWLKAGWAPAYDVLIPDAEFRTALAEGKNPMMRSRLLPGAQSIVDEIRALGTKHIISAETATAALAEYGQLADTSFWT
ncbi:MAG TPA: ATPase, T2SS/T4P/T4SS family [Tepidisphaeraceae bacterium]|jgi:twitching motility protein PilT|nr:ATPase, T2SS/T4P/T4SS family [Tepidisphaeraceae bacterium]